MRALFNFIWMRYGWWAVFITVFILTLPFGLRAGGVEVWLMAYFLVVAVAAVGLLWGASRHLDKLRIRFLEAAMKYYIHNANEGIIDDTTILQVQLFVKACPWVVGKASFDLHKGARSAAHLYVSGIVNIAFDVREAGGRPTFPMNRWYVLRGVVYEELGAYPPGEAPPRELQRLLIRAVR